MFAIEKEHNYNVLDITELNNGKEDHKKPEVLFSILEPEDILEDKKKSALLQEKQIIKFKDNLELNKKRNTNADQTAKKKKRKTKLLKEKQLKMFEDKEKEDKLKEEENRQLERLANVYDSIYYKWKIINRN